MLSRLLNSSHPEDLKAANKLIKEMVQEVHLCSSLCIDFTVVLFVCDKRNEYDTCECCTQRKLIGSVWGNWLVCLGGGCHWRSDSTGISGVIGGEKCNLITMLPSALFSFSFFFISFSYDCVTRMLVVWHLSYRRRIRSGQRKCRRGWTPSRRWKRASPCWLSSYRTMTARQPIRATQSSYRWAERQN